MCGVSRCENHSSPLSSRNVLGPDLDNQLPGRLFRRIGHDRHIVHRLNTLEDTHRLNRLSSSTGTRSIEGLDFIVVYEVVGQLGDEALQKATLESHANSRLRRGKSDRARVHAVQKKATLPG